MPRDLDQGLRLDKNATAIALGYLEGLELKPLVDAVSPQIAVPMNGQYPKYAVGSWYDDNEDTVAAHATHVVEWIPPVETWTAYIIEMHAKKVAIADLEANNDSVVPGMVYSDRTVAAKRLTDIMFQKYCKAVADIMAATSNTATPVPKWDADGGLPFDNLQTWIKALKDLIGIGGYTGLTTDRVMWHLGEGSRAKYSHTGSMSNYEIVEKLVTRDLGINRLLISDAGERYVAGSTAFQSIWGNNFYLFKNAQNPDGWAPTHMATLVPKGKPFIQVMAPYGREQLDLLGDFIQVRMYYLIKELDTNAVYKGNAVIS